jgi:hypothetical protein
MNDDHDIWTKILDFLIAGLAALIAVCTAFVASGYLTWWLL